MEDAEIMLGAAKRLYKADKSAANKQMVKSAKAAVQALAAAPSKTCEECEETPATLACTECEMVYCEPCSTKQHSKV
jgi:hypothetical protein